MHRVHQQAWPKSAARQQTADNHAVQQQSNGRLWQHGSGGEALNSIGGRPAAVRVAPQAAAMAAQGSYSALHNHSITFKQAVVTNAAPKGPQQTTLLAFAQRNGQRSSQPSTKHAIQPWPLPAWGTDEDDWQSQPGVGQSAGDAAPAAAMPGPSEHQTAALQAGADAAEAGGRADCRSPCHTSGSARQVRFPLQQ